MDDSLDRAMNSNTNEILSRSLVVDAFRRDAEEIVSVYSGDEDLRQDKAGRRLAFAAFEAQRRVELEREGKFYTVFYWVFLCLTLVGAPAVALLVHDDFRSVTWDCVGLGSTVLLLSVTYGGYIVWMARGAWGTFAEFFRDIFDVTGSSSAARAARTTAAQNTAGFHIALFMIGMLFAAFAGACLWGVCHELLGHPLECQSSLPVQLLKDCIDSRHHRHDLYCLFVVFVFVLAILFILMDGYVAKTDRHHSETFDASLSLVFSTIPMAFGVSVILAYLGFTYLHFRYFEHLSHAVAMLQMPVEFASGALTFQMVLSNVLFVLIKLKIFPKTVVAATKSTASP